MSNQQKANNFFNTPIAVSDSFAKSVTDNAAGQFVFAAGAENHSILRIEDGLAMIDISGPMDHRLDEWSLSYEEIRAAFDEAISSGDVSAIALVMDTPGGVVNGLFDLTDAIFAARRQKPIYAIVNDHATSAGYAIAAATKQIIGSRTSSTGSIGVRAIHVDASKYYNDMGLKFTTIYAGDRKTDLSPYKPLSDEAKAILQQSVNESYDLFTSKVAEYRGKKLTKEQAIATQAGTYEGETAKKAGLIDDVASFEEAIQLIREKEKLMNLSDLKTGLSQFLSGDLKAETETALSTLGFVRKTEAAEMPDVDAIKVEAETSGKTAGIEEGKAEGAKVAMATATEIMNLCIVDGKPDLAIELIRSGASIDGAREKLLALKADEDKTKGIKSTVGALSTGSTNPLLADAMRRAGK